MYPKNFRPYMYNCKCETSLKFVQAFKNLSHKHRVESLKSRIWVFYVALLSLLLSLSLSFTYTNFKHLLFTHCWTKSNEAKFEKSTKCSKLWTYTQCKKRTWCEFFLHISPFLPSLLPLFSSSPDDFELSSFFSCIDSVSMLL